MLNGYIFESKVPLNEWLEKIKTSEFNDPKRYDNLKHNCANGTLFALEAADIPLPITKFVFPANSALPMDPANLFYSVKLDKLKTVYEAKSNPCYDFTEFRIKLWSETHPSDSNKNLVTEIVEEIDKRQQQHPEHIDAHIDVLMQTYQLITQLPTAEKCDVYLKSSEQFHQRNMSKNFKKAILLNLMSSLVGSALGYGAFKFLASSIPAVFHKTLSVILPSIGFFKSPKKSTFLNGPTSYNTETKLTENMKKLSELRRAK